METLYIVIYRQKDGPWKSQDNGVFTERRLADNFAECLNTQFETIEHVVVEGPIVSPDAMAEAEARLGAF